MPLNALYDRKLLQVGDRWMIHSTCRTCGATIVGNISEKLHEQEMEHAEECQLTRQKASTAS